MGRDCARDSAVVGLQEGGSRMKHAGLITGRGKLLRANCLLALALAFGVSLAFTTAASARVLRVAQSHPRGTAAPQFHSIQAAVDAARPGDWILVAPGDYHERGDYTTHKPSDEAGAGVLITTPKIHLRGLDRNGVVVDGTKPGSPRCSSAAADQDLGPHGPDGTPLGRNGVEVFKASGVTVENLTACNFLTGSGGGGNQIGFNGGDGSGQIGMGSFRGDYLSATVTYYGG